MDKARAPVVWLRITAFGWMVSHARLFSNSSLAI
jgi:hypothetical protein